MLTLAAKSRLRAAARSAQPGRRCPQALDIFVELLDIANNDTGIAVPRPGTLERRLDLSRSTLRRGVELLRMAGLVETTFIHDRRGYRCGVRYRVIREEPGRLWDADALAPTASTAPPILAAYGARMHPHVRTRSQRSKKSSTSSRALSAPPRLTAEVAKKAAGPDAAERIAHAQQTAKADFDAATLAASPDRRFYGRLTRPAVTLATPGMVQKTVWDVAAGRKVIDIDVYELQYEVHRLLLLRRMKGGDEPVREAIAHVHRQQQRLDDDTGARARRRRRDRKPQMPGPRYFSRRSVVTIPTDPGATLTPQQWAAIQRQYRDTVNESARAALRAQLAPLLDEKNCAR